ncbi:MAG: hypothetical protein M1131_03220 [Actinobacteria bacterium]|jgi:hypothetical protein|nr:hypothetical protein [Actinomycetota bacterium]MCL6095731.1 hypothetical protein [Actinomycetota bacterium]
MYIASSTLVVVLWVKTDLVSSLLGKVAEIGARATFEALGDWVASGAVAVLKDIATILVQSTHPRLTSSWFLHNYQLMLAIAAIAVVPVACISMMQAIVHQSLSELTRSMLLRLPIAVVAMVVAVNFVQLMLEIANYLSDVVMANSGHGLHAFITSLVGSLGGFGVVGGVPSSSQPVLAPFVLFFGSLIVVCGAVAIWMELFVRESAVYVAVLFLPLALASLVWPTIAHWSRRLIEVLFALIFSKFVIVCVISLAFSALAASSEKGSVGLRGMNSLLGGGSLLLMAAFAPYALFRLISVMELSAITHLEDVSHRMVNSTPIGYAKNSILTALAGGTLPLEGIANNDTIPIAQGRDPGSDLSTYLEADAAWLRNAKSSLIEQVNTGTEGAEHKIKVDPEEDRND